MFRKPWYTQAAGPRWPSLQAQLHASVQNPGDRAPDPEPIPSYVQYNVWKNMQDQMNKCKTMKPTCQEQNQSSMGAGVYDVQFAANREAHKEDEMKKSPHEE